MPGRKIARTEPNTASDPANQYQRLVFLLGRSSRRSPTGTDMATPPVISNDDCRRLLGE